MSWLIIKLNLIFHLLCVLGLYIFGVGPALQVVSKLFQESQLDYKEVTFKRMFSLWRIYFKRSNYQFYFFLGLFLFVTYNLYLSIQMIGFFWLMLDFLLVTMLVSLFVCYQYIIVYEGYYVMSFLQSIKLAIISLFLNFRTFWKILIGISIILGITWYMKGLFIFGTISLILAWNVIATQKDREFIDWKRQEYVQ